MNEIKIVDLDKPIPKEFPGVEYEIKFNIKLFGEGKEPSIKEYLDALDISLDKSRYCICPNKSISSGTNYYIGDALNECFVVMENNGKLFLKEKGEQTPVQVGIKAENLVTKRKEKVYETSLEEVMKKTMNRVQENSNSAELKYLGRIRKEKGDIYAVDNSDGRIYCITISKCFLDKNNKDVQRQLEIEYVGYSPGIKKFKKNSEKNIIQGLTYFANFLYEKYNNKKISENYTIRLEATKERKYDFVVQNISNGGEKYVPNESGI